MTAFRLRLHRRSPESQSPLPGDVLRNVDTGNQWRILAARPVRTRVVDVEYPRVVAMDVQRMAPGDDAGECIVWEFERDRRRGR